MSDLIERLRDTRWRNNCNTTLQKEAADRIEELESVVDVVRAIKWRSIDKDNMEFATTCFVVDKVRDAVAALSDMTAGGQDMPSDLIDLVRSQRGGTTMAEDLLIERIEELEAALKEIVHGSSDGMTHGGIKCRAIAKAALKEQT